MRPLFSIFLVLLCLTIVAPGRAQTASANTALVPVSELEKNGYNWFQRHADILAIKDKLHPQIVLIGDSITNFWAGVPKGAEVHGPNAWKEAFDDLPVLNLGFGWDRTQNVLWRLDHGEFDGLTPRVVVVNIGTNNLHQTSHARANTPAEIVEAILKICDEVHAKSPPSRIIVMGIFPKGSPAADPRRPGIAALNELLGRTLASTHPDIKFLDIGAQFLQPDGSEIPGVMLSDGVHPTDKGYSIWAKALLAAGVRN